VLPGVGRVADRDPGRPGRLASLAAMSIDVRPGQVLGRYVLESAIGSGGFASVYRAVDTMLDRPVALKVLDQRAHRNPTVARRFLLEGRAVASLDHPAVVPVYDAGEHDDLLWMAMRLVVGGSLEDALGAGRRFTPAEVVALVDRIGPALDHAHSQGVVHRDVKPSNILLGDGDPARAWLADFGIAATARTAGRYTTGTLGTAAYMAPEQARPSEVGPSADVYSLGCVVFELVTGDRPFPGTDHIALLMAHATAPVPTVGDPAVDELFARTLAKAPADRPPSGGAFAAELHTVLLGSATAAPAAAALTDPVPASSEDGGGADPAPTGLGDGRAVDPAAADTVMSPEAGAHGAPTVADERTMQYAAAHPPSSRDADTVVAPGVPARPPAPPPPPPPGAPRPVSPLPPTGPVPGPAPESRRPRFPTVARRGRSQARRNLFIGAAALAVAAVALVLASRSSDEVAGTRQCDDVGLCITLPDGWEVGAVRPGLVTLLRDGQPEAAYTNSPAPGDDAASVLAGFGSQACADEPRSARFGDAEGVRCSGSGPDGGELAAAVHDGTLVVLDVGDSVPADEASAVLDSLTFG
jgi:tRNA A-37 threonylcarbamoyl transferase component Bud32